MRKILVVGSGGAGKSVFSTHLARLTGLPLIQLDRFYWRPGWVEPSNAEWSAVVEGLITGDEWIMDGNYGGTLEKRLAACDAVVYLDLPRLLCLWRVIRRRIRFHRRSRPDMTDGCAERLTMGFIRWIWEYPSKRRPRLLERLGELRDDQRVVILRNRSEVEAFLRSLAPAS
jgi:adenylate kinase family enzyme